MGLWWATACGGWPLWLNLPEESGLIPVGSSSPDLEWAARESVEPDGWPSEVTPIEIGVGQGVRATGALAGSGWDPRAAAATVEGCDGPAVRNAATSGGDYLADTDLIVVDVPDGGMVCAGAAFGDDGFGWDLLLFPVDDCGAPASAVIGGGGAIGVDLGGAAGGWSISVPGGRYAVQLAAYAPDDPGVSLPWALEVSVPGPGAPCPGLPEAP